MRDIKPGGDTSNARWQRDCALLAIPLDSRVGTAQLEKQLQQRKTEISTGAVVREMR